MRLIDADELRKCAIPCEIRNGALTDLCVPLYQIDNAPTIKTFTLIDIEEQYRKGLEKGLSEWETERPTGEWIYTNKEDKQKGYGGYCSVCQCDMPIGINDWKQEYYESKFCPNCGAEMKGGTE